MRIPSSRGRVLQKLHRLLAPAAATKILAKIELVDEGVATQPFEAVAETEERISDGIVAIENDPCTAEIWILQQWNQSGAGLIAIIAVAIESVILPHKVEKKFYFRHISDTKLRAVRHSASHYVLERQRHTHATADAECRHALPGVALQHLVQQSDGNACARAADGMSQSDRASVDVQAVAIEVQYAVASQDLRGKGLVPVRSNQIRVAQTVLICQLL